MDLTIVDDYKELSKKNLYKVSSAVEIFRYYVGEFKISQRMSSPFRTDKNPSFAIYYNKWKDEIRFKDFASIEGDCVTLVATMYGLSYFDAMRKINSDLKLGLGFDGNFQCCDDRVEFTGENLSDAEVIKKSKKLIQFKPKKFSEEDYAYWKQYGITKEILIKYHVYSAQSVFLNKVKVWGYSKSNPIFVYHFPRTDNIKAYRPFGEKYKKWLSNASNDWDIQGYDQLDETGDLLILTKSMKDVMVLHTMGIEAIATHGENHYINPDFIRHIKKRFKNIVVMYDDDEAGRLGASRLQEDFDIPSIFLEISDGTKDISDYVKDFGYDYAKEYLNLKLNDIYSGECSLF